MILIAFIAVLVAGSLVYCLLVVLAAIRHTREPRPPAAAHPNTFISVLKPLSGIEEGLRENLVSFFEQDYSRYELLFAVQYADDPAAPLLQSLMALYPHISCRFLITGKSPYTSPKVYSLSLMTAAATHDLLVLSDSDIRVDRTFLSRIAAELATDRYDLATCPYRAVPGDTIWSRLEALGMNTEFWGGVLVAKLMEGVRFAVGPTVVARRKVLNAIPWSTLSGYHAEDFVLGQRAAEKGFRVDLSHCVVEHRLGSDTFRTNFLHRMRWGRSTRRSRPWGYVGQVFTYPLPLALLLVGFAHSLWPILILTAILRAWAADAVSHGLLDNRLSARSWLWMPVQDLLGFVFWLAGFTGNSIHWRGRRYRLRADGTLELLR
ncbi:MAG: glycosyltransferase [Bryobacteraceae bacterium]